MLKLKKIYKSYKVDKASFPALKNINLNFSNCGFVSILGPSGCGKTTLLNLIGGLDHYDEGDLIIDEKSTKDFTDRDWDAYRNQKVGFVFQTYNLVPHLSILSNVELSLTLTGMGKKERASKALNALKNVGLKEIAKKKPNQLSGGQMQRVAIARALVNNPEIILADEPTGALDSVTSVQVMQLLEQISKKRLVIMVTHNVELANKYSTRIIKLKDGKVIDDTIPNKSLDSKDKISKEIADIKQKHTHMSFFTALGNSFKNLLTKKGRTTLTAVAASFGVIGVALVLAMSNGFTNYISRIESSTASTVPVTIAPFVTTSLKTRETPEAWPDTPVIKPYSEDISSLMVVHHNDITRDYANYCKNLLHEPNHYASSVLENHEYLDFNLFTKRKTADGGEGKIIKVDQFASAGAISSIVSGTTSLPSTIFHELYGGKEYINSLYDVIAGDGYPSEELIDNHDGTFTSEVCLVCDRYNEIPIKTLYKLGLTPTDQVREGETISFDSLIGHEYHAYLPDKVFTAVQEEPITKEVEVRDLVAKDGVINLFDENILSPTTRKQTITSYVDVAAEKGNQYLYPDRLEDLYNRPDIKIKIKCILRIKKDSTINLMPGSIAYPTSLKDFYVNKLQDDKASPITLRIKKAAKQNWGITTTGNYDADKALWLAFLLALQDALQSNNVNKIIEYLNSEFSPIAFYNLLIDDNDPAKGIERDSKNPYNTFQKNNYRFSNEFKTPTIVYKDVEGKKIPIGYRKDSDIDFINLANYVCSYSTITSILIFARDLSCKQNIFNYLNKWNEGKEDSQQIKYSDVAGTLTDALGTLINIVSIVLICFSAVSLLVSCVMTGVITYTSVLERTKEIGVLRAIGARKKDVGRLFEAESVIVGIFGGLIGIAITFILEAPISLIIANMFPTQHIGMICNLNPLHALILILISGLLTFVAGFIPSRKASKKDPVVALRSE